MNTTQLQKGSSLITRIHAKHPLCHSRLFHLHLFASFAVDLCFPLVSVSLIRFVVDRKDS